MGREGKAKRRKTAGPLRASSFPKSDATKRSERKKSEATSEAINKKTGAMEWERE